MRRVALAALLLSAFVFLAGVLLGWPYALMIGCGIAGLNILINRRKS
ncbi:MAG: hypothetical protein P4L50_03390 [Anaerolineaceae bacterium]|nr:hypothetical protein [Anaerolineaceae bacterium]